MFHLIARRFRVPLRLRFVGRLRLSKAFTILANMDRQFLELHRQEHREACMHRHERPGGKGHVVGGPKQDSETQDDDEQIHNDVQKQEMPFEKRREDTLYFCPGGGAFSDDCSDDLFRDDGDQGGDNDFGEFAHNGGAVSREAASAGPTLPRGGRQG